MMRLCGVAVASISLLVIPLRASSTAPEEVGRDSSTARASVVIVESSIDSADVLLDGKCMGKTPVTLGSLSAGRHEVVVQHPDRTSWLAPVLAESLVVAPGDTQTVHFRFPRRFMISTDPYGAEVLAADSIYGRTPLLLTVPPGKELGTVTLRKDGYDTLTLDPDTLRRGFYRGTLTPVWQRDENREMILGTIGHKRSNTVPLYVTGTLTVVSGIAAAYFKTQADERFAEYNRTGDPGLLSQTHRLDTAAGVTLATTQVGLLLFSYFLLSE